LENGGLEKILAFKSPVKICLILLASLISLGEITGSSTQSENTSFVTQKVSLLTPVPFGSTPGPASSPSSPPAGAVTT